MATRDEDFVTRIFIANTHTPVLFFSSRGMAYKMIGLAAAARGAAGARQGAGQSAAARQGRDHHHHPAAARGRSVLGQARRDVRHQLRQRAAQQAVRLHRGAPERQDRHEARCRRPHRRRGCLQRAATTCCSPRRKARRSASPSSMCACSRAAIHLACAGSSWKRATRSSPWRSSAISRPPPPSAPPMCGRPTAVRRGGAEMESDMEAEEGSQEAVVLSARALRRAQRA